MDVMGVWVFCGNGGSLPSAVFADLANAEDWIKKHSLSGVLTEYPLDIGVYEWAQKMGYFTPKSPSQATPSFIGKFSSAYLRHFHFQNGDKE